MKTMIMIDGEFLRSKCRSSLRQRLSADIVRDFIIGVHRRLGLSETDPHRTYFYDCRPADKKDAVLPVSKKLFDFTASPMFKERNRQLDEINAIDFLSLRLGQVSFKGWTLRNDKGSSSAVLSDDDYKPDFQQKGVDMKIGLDIAWASYNKMAENIVLVTGDSDFVPAIKVARRNGLFAYILTLSHGVKPDLTANADILITDGIREFFTTTD